jgi:hypothetical protein
LHIIFPNTLANFCCFNYCTNSVIPSYSVSSAVPGGRAVKGVGLGRLVAGIVGVNPAQGMDLCLCVSVFCCPVSVEAFATG